MEHNPDIDDATIVARVLSGDAASFSTLVERHAGTLAAVAWSRLGAAEDARDVVQQALFTAYARLPALRDRGRFGAWARGIARNLALKALESRRRRERLAEMRPETLPEPDPMERIAGEERDREVRRALSGLDEARREVVVLHYFEGLRVAEVAFLTERPAGSVKRMLHEARALLREELIRMAPQDFHESRLGEERRRRLATVARFPRTEPEIAVTPLAVDAEPVRARSVHGAFVALSTGAEACFADYDHPGGRLTGVTHVRVDGPVDIAGRTALRLDHLDFGEESDTRWVWRPHYEVTGDSALYCAKQFGDAGAELPLVTPDHPDWGEPEPRPESLRLVPGSVREPNGEQIGLLVDETLSEVRVGARAFRCLRRVSGGGRQEVSWADRPLATIATEEYFLPDGRLLLWRRYNGEWWSRENPANEGKEHRTFEALTEAGVAELEVFGERYRLFYDQLPDYAVKQR